MLPLPDLFREHKAPQLESVCGVFVFYTAGFMYVSETAAQTFDSLLSLHPHCFIPETVPASANAGLPSVKH